MAQSNCWQPLWTDWLDFILFTHIVLYCQSTCPHLALSSVVQKNFFHVPLWSGYSFRSTVAKEEGGTGLGLGEGSEAHWWREPETNIPQVIALRMDRPDFLHASFHTLSLCLDHKDHLDSYFWCSVQLLGMHYFTAVEVGSMSEMRGSATRHPYPVWSPAGVRKPASMSLWSLHRCPTALVCLNTQLPRVICLSWKPSNWVLSFNSIIVGCRSMMRKKIFT